MENAALRYLFDKIREDDRSNTYHVGVYTILFSDWVTKTFRSAAVLSLRTKRLRSARQRKNISLHKRNISYVRMVLHQFPPMLYRSVFHHAS